MKQALADLVWSGGTTFAVAGGVVAVALGAWAVYRYIRGRPTAAELERRRRNALRSRGKVGDANLLEYHDHLVFYSYAVGGVEYAACQDLSDLQAWLPADLWSAVGPASIRYDPRNPANSILLCEEWTGLRPAPRVKSD